MIVLDTHAWIWWASNSKKLSVRAKQSIDEADELGVSAISCWETAMLVQKRRLELDREVLLWLRQALALPRVTLIPLTAEIAVIAANLPKSFHGDPADRILVGSTLAHKAKLVTKDRRIRSFGEIRTMW